MASLSTNAAAVPVRSDVELAGFVAR